MSNVCSFQLVFVPLLPLIQMIILSFVIALIYAAPTTTSIPELPAELLLPIVSNIASFKDLITFNMTSKAAFPLIRPIFDFSTACQIEIRRASECLSTRIKSMIWIYALLT